MLKTFLLTWNAGQMDLYRKTCLTAQGWMPKPFWELLTHPKSSGRWDNLDNAALRGLMAAASEKPKK